MTKVRLETMRFGNTAVWAGEFTYVLIDGVYLFSCPSVTLAITPQMAVVVETWSTGRCLHITSYLLASKGYADVP